MRRDRGIKKGGPRDPVAQSIRNEQMRDAAPSAEEAKRMFEKRLSDEGCIVCGEDDPDNLNLIQWGPHQCSAHQHPGKPRETVMCDEHERHGSELRRARVFKRARDRDATAVVFYNCLITEYAVPPEPNTETIKRQVGWDEDDNPMYEEQEVEIPRRHLPRPEVPVKCRCGEGIKEIVYLDD